MNTDSQPRSGHLSFYLVIASVFLFVSTMMTFVNSVNADFVNWDDDIYVTENPRVQSFSSTNIKEIISTSYYYAWIPITLVSHAVDVALWGMNPKGHHLTNVLLHSINAVLFFLVTMVVIDASRGENDRAFHKRITSSLLVGGVISALLFAMHPLRAESVAWVSGRKDLLCAQFLLLSLWTYILWKQHRRKGSLLLSTVLFALALLSKPMAMPFPIILVLLDIWLLNRKTEQRFSWNNLLADKLGFFFLSVVVGAITWLAASGGNMNVLGELNTIERLLLPFYMIVFYLVKLVVPLGLSPIYPDFDRVLFFLSPVIVALLLYASMLMMKRNLGGFILALTSFVLILMPTFLGVSSGLQPLADRYTYLSTLSIFMLIGGGIDLMWRASASSPGKKYQRELFAIVLLGLCAVSSYRTIRQVSVWHNSESLWKQALRYAPDNVDQYQQRKPYMKPNYTDAMVNLGAAYYGRNDMAKALEQFRHVLVFDSCNADAYYNIGNVLYENAETGESLASFEHAVKCDPSYAKAYYNLGILFAARDSVALAVRSFQSAARLGYSEAQKVLTERGYSW